MRVAEDGVGGVGDDEGGVGGVGNDGSHHNVKSKAKVVIVSVLAV